MRLGACVLLGDRPGFGSSSTNFHFLIYKRGLESISLYKVTVNMGWDNIHKSFNLIPDTEEAAFQQCELEEVAKTL